MHLLWFLTHCAVLYLVRANTTHLEVADSLYSPHNNNVAVTGAPVHEYVQERRPELRGNSILSPFMNFFKPRGQELQQSASTDYSYILSGASNGMDQGAGYDFNGGHIFNNGYQNSFQNHGIHNIEHVDDSHGHAHSFLKHQYARDIAMGFIGFLIVLSTLQNALISVSRGESRIAIHGHKRRDITTPEPDMIKLPEVTTLSSPSSSSSPSLQLPDAGDTSLEIIEPLPQGKKDKWLLHEDENIRCLQKKACVANQELVKQYGMSGKVLASYISKLAAKKKQSIGWMRLVQDAGLAGLKGVDCSVLYRGCHKKFEAKNLPET